jgi:chloride channel protein, CIC family
MALPRLFLMPGRQTVEGCTGAGRATDRVRVPTPIIRWRIATGRGATEQPNAISDGPAALTPLLWVMVVLTGVGAGLFGVLMMLILYTVEHLAYSYHTGSFEAGVEHASASRRMVALTIAGVVGGVGWYLLRRYTKGQKSDADEAVWCGDGTLSFPRSIGTSVLSEIVVGLGASLGREAAPKLMGAVSASLLGHWTRLSADQRRLLVACGAGAGLAAVYNVPLGGALFTAEVLCASITLPVVLPALACSWIATLTARIYLPAQATYSGTPAYPFTSAELIWAILAGPVIGLIAVGFIRLIAWVSHRRPTGWPALVAPLVALVILGAIGVRYPQLFGNGKGIAQDAFLGQTGLLLLLALFLLKPLVTALCLGSGASGGLFTPTLSTGALLGGSLGAAWSLIWPTTPAGAYAIIGAAAMLGAAMQAPLAGLALVIELTDSRFQLVLPMMAATLIATAVARYIDGYSIYSARLPACERAQDEKSPAPTGAQISRQTSHRG